MLSVALKLNTRTRLNSFTPTSNVLCQTTAPLDARFLELLSFQCFLCFGVGEKDIIFFFSKLQTEDLHYCLLKQDAADHLHMVLVFS